MSFTGLWDTGATLSAITQQVVDACHLAPVDVVKVHGISGPELAEVYLVNIFLPNQVVFPRTWVTKAKSIMGADVLIGMDIISKGDFAVTHPDGKTQFTFRVPTQADIDFVKEDRPENQRQSMNNLAKANQSRRTPGNAKRKRNPGRR